MQQRSSGNMLAALILMSCCTCHPLTGLARSEDSAPTLQRLLLDLQRAVDVGAAQPVSIGASIGVAFFPADGADADELIAVADQRMFIAKRGGRNRIVDASPRAARPQLQVIDSR